MSETLQRTAPAQRPVYQTMNQAAAALGEFGTAPATPRPPARDPGRPRATIAQPAAQSDPEAYQDTAPDWRPPAQRDYGRPDATQYDDPTGEQPQDDTGDGGDEQQPVQLAEDTVLWTADDGDPVTLAEAQRGYLRQADYTRKTQWVAGLHQQLTAHVGEVEADREAVAELILNSLPRLDPAAVAGMDGSQVLQLQQERERMLGFVQQLRQRNAAERERLQEAELQAAQQAIPIVLPEWVDPQVRERQQQAAVRYLDALGVPEQTRNLINRNPWLVKMAIQAATGRPVLQGAQRGRQAQQQQRGGAGGNGAYPQASPSLPAGHGAPPPPPQSQRDRGAMQQQARGGGSYRSRFSAGVALLQGTAPRR